MRCFVCNEKTRTIYSHPIEPRSIAKVCDKCGWMSHPVKIPEAIK